MRGPCARDRCSDRSLFIDRFIAVRIKDESILLSFLRNNGKVRACYFIDRYRSIELDRDRLDGSIQGRGLRTGIS